MLFLAGQPERMFDMIECKHMGRRVLLWLLLFVSTLAPLPCFSLGLETLNYPKSEDVCSYQDSIKMTGPKWWDKPMSAALNASVAVGNGVFSNVAKGAIRLMIVGGMLWLAIFILKIVGGMVESDPMENVTKIGGMMLRIGIAAALLSNRDFFFDYFFAPIIQAGAGFVGAGGSSGGMDGGLAGATRAAKEIAETIHKSVVGVQADAWHMKCMSKIQKLELGFDFMFWDPGIFFSGCMIYAAAFAFGLVFPIFLIDACFRMGVVAALCPLFIVAWVFQSTRDYASKGFQATLNVAFTFMMVKIAMDIALKMIVGSSGLESISGGPAAEKKVLCTYRFINFSNSDPCSGIATGSTGTTSNILVFAASVAYGLLLLRQGASELAGYFAGASFSNDTAFQAAKGGAQAMVSGAHHAVSGTAKAAGAAVTIGSKAAGAISHAKDRSAARRVEDGRRKMEGGGTLSKGERAKYDKAERRLRRSGFIDKNGGEKEGYKDLLSNSRARNIAGRLNDRFGNGEKFHDRRNDYHQRSADEVAALKAGRKFDKNNPSSKAGASTSASSNAAPNARPKGVPQNALYDSKSKTWTSEYKDKNGTSRTTVMDEKGGRLSVTDKDKNGKITTQTQYKNGNPVKTTAYSYDSNGQKVGETESSKGKTTFRSFDKDGKPLSVTEKADNGTTTKSEWSRDKNGSAFKASETRSDASGSQKMMFDEKGNTTSSTRFDSAGNKTGETKFTRDQNGKTTHLDVYDGKGNKTETTDFSYDSSGKMTSATKYDAGGRKVSEEAYSYDKDGKNSGSSKTTFNADGSKKVEVRDGNMNTLQEQHYDKGGNLSKMKDAQGEHRYTRDAAGKVTHTDHFDTKGNKTGSNDFS